MSELKESMSWDERAKRVFAQGCNTYSKRSDQYVYGVHDTHINADKNLPFIDTVCGLGANFDGYGGVYSLPTFQEVECAERLQKLFPVLEKMRFLKTGSEACQAAVRIARAYAENNSQKKTCFYVGGCGYHGWHNIFIAEEKPGTGTIYEFYNKFYEIDDLIEAIDKFSDTCCAAIIEPVQLDASEERRAKVLKLREICTAKNVCLIFDEVITGMRFRDFCVANHWGIKPDLICLGKALGNGNSFAVVGGSAKYMDTPGWFVSSTFAGELSGINACIDSVLIYCEPKNIYIDYCNESERLMNDINKIGRGIVWLEGYGTRGEWRARDEETKAIFMQEMWDRGVLVGKAWFVNKQLVSIGEKDKRNRLVSTVSAVVEQIKAGKCTLRGEMPKPVFKRN